MVFVLLEVSLSLKLLGLSWFCCCCFLFEADINEFYVVYNICRNVRYNYINENNEYNTNNTDVL